MGGYTKSDYDELRVIEKNGISIAFLSYTYGTNGSRVNSGSPEYLVPRIEDETILRQLKKARSARTRWWCPCTGATRPPTPPT